jgi:hypothetical protein
MVVLQEESAMSVAEPGSVNGWVTRRVGPGGEDGYALVIDDLSRLGL